MGREVVVGFVTMRLEKLGRTRSMMVHIYILELRVLLGILRRPSLRQNEHSSLMDLNSSW